MDVADTSHFHAVEAEFSAGFCGLKCGPSRITDVATVADNVATTGLDGVGWGSTASSRIQRFQSDTMRRNAVQSAFARS